MPRRRSSRRSVLPRGTKGLLYALLGIPVIGWLLAKTGLIPAEYFLPVTVAGSKHKEQQLIVFPFERNVLHGSKHKEQQLRYTHTLPLGLDSA